MIINAEYDKKIQKWLEENRQTIIDKWMDLIRIPSVRGEAAPDAPFGAECARAVAKANEYYAQAGFETHHYPDRGYALASYGEGEKTVGLFAHCDVVPVGDGWMYTQPFAPKIIEGTMVGRGTSDDKAGVMASWAVLSMLKECDIPIQGKILAFSGSNEESGMGDITAFVKHERIPELSLSPDGTFPCSVGEKGILRMWTECQTPMVAIEDFRGGDAFNVVLDKAEVVLSANEALEKELKALLQDNTAVTMTLEETGKICLKAQGAARHAGNPKGGVNATLLAAQVLEQCRTLPETDRKAMATLSKFLGDFDGEGMGIAVVDPDFGPLTSANGMVAVEDGKLRVSLDIRYGVVVDHEEIEKDLARIWEAEGWKIVYMFNRKGFNAPKDSPVPEIVVGVCKEVAGKDLKPFRMAGGTYCRYLPNAFPVGVAISGEDGVTAKLTFPAGHGGAHQRDESLLIDNFFRGIRILAHTVIACDEALHK